MLLISLTQPINNGIKAPPEIAIIIKPEISFPLVGCLSIVMENTSGKILATARPIRNTNTHAIKCDLKKRMAIKQTNPSIDVHIKNLREEIFVSIIAPEKVPNVRPKK